MMDPLEEMAYLKRFISLVRISQPAGQKTLVCSTATIRRWTSSVLLWWVNFLSSTWGHPEPIRVTGSSRRVAVVRDPSEEESAGLPDRRNSGMSFHTSSESVRRPVGGLAIGFVDDLYANGSRFVSLLADEHVVILGVGHPNQQQPTNAPL